LFWIDCAYSINSKDNHWRKKLCTNKQLNECRLKSHLSLNWIDIGFVSGHGFSRAPEPRQARALAPETIF
jgi:hypothetical protein